MLFCYRSIFLLLISMLGLSQCHNRHAATALVKDSIKVINPARANAIDSNQTPLKNMFGINSYEWNFLETPAAPNDRNHIYEANMALIKSFSAVRHYLNWNKLENTEGNYTYNPTNNGNWYYDVIYNRCKQDSITGTGRYQKPAGLDDEHLPGRSSATMRTYPHFTGPTVQNPLRILCRPVPLSSLLRDMALTLK
jgi:hypothetical protein